MKTRTAYLAANALLILAIASPAQTIPEITAPSGPDGEIFAPENAVLDTSIPFAIGAREALQELRGAFGWPTFQEGLVDGVYFRLDPDGYARFSPTPRLDADVFEVVCQPRTTSCTGRKGILSVYLGTTGLIELKIEGAAPGDTYYIVVNQVETPVPERILMPLDVQLETLLAYGGELIVRRGAAETARISLKGFGPVAAYLRWIGADQNYVVLPRDWPIPGSRSLTEEPDSTPPTAHEVDKSNTVLEETPSAGTILAAGPPLGAITLSEAQYVEILSRLLKVEAKIAQMTLTAPEISTIGETESPHSLPIGTENPVPMVLSSADLEELLYLTNVVGLELQSALMVLRRGIPDANDLLPLENGDRTELPTIEVPGLAIGTSDFMELSEYLSTVEAAVLQP